MDVLRSAFIIASSFISLPPVDSTERKSAPSFAEPSKVFTMASQYFPLRIIGGRLISLKSLGVILIALFKPYLSS